MQNHPSLNPCDLNQLFLDIQKPIHRYLARKVAAHDVEDVFQDVCLNIWQSIHDLKHKDEALTWAYRIARFRVMDYYRSLYRQPTEDVAQWDLVVDEKTLTKAEQHLYILEAKKHICELKGSIHDIAVLYFICGLPPREICDSLLLNIHTVKSCIKRTKNLLAAKLAA